MKVTVYLYSTNNTLKAVIQNGYSTYLSSDDCNGEWIFEINLQLQTDPNLINRLNPNQVNNDINQQRYHVGYYGLTSTGYI